MSVSERSVFCENTLIFQGTSEQVTDVITRVALKLGFNILQALAKGRLGNEAENYGDS